MQAARADAEKDLSGEEIRELRLVLKRQGFQGRDIVLAAPDQSLLRGVFDLPRQVSGAPVSQIARMELSRMHQVPPDSEEKARKLFPKPDTLPKIFIVTDNTIKSIGLLDQITVPLTENNAGDAGAIF